MPSHAAVVAPRGAARPRHAARGLTLIELIMTIALLATMTTLALPAARTWISDARVRTAAESLRDVMRVAQAEAVRRNRQVVVWFTHDASVPTPATAIGASHSAPNGTTWAMYELPQLGDGTAAFVRAGRLTEATPGIALDTHATNALCFNPGGRLVANANPGPGGASCVGTMAQFDIAQAGVANRPLRLVVATAGQVRMCDPAKPLSNGAPDGC